ncbi:unnamed protein product, partial [marine sediment metagenome]
ALLFGCTQTLSQDTLLSNQGLQEISKGNYPQAEEYLSQALTLNPKNPYALLNMGVVYHNTGQKEKARQMYKKVIAFNPKEEAGHSNRESNAGKTLADIARNNLKLLEREQADTAASKKKPAKKRPSVSLAQGRAKKMTSAKKAVSPSPTPNRPERKMAKNMNVDHYMVQKGDTLFKIAGRKDVYGDSMMWPSLFCRNLDRLGDVKPTENLQHQELTKLLGLKFVTSSQASERSSKTGQNRWAVNVLSALDPQSTIQPYITLINNGYHVYITKK